MQKAFDLSCVGFVKKIIIENNNPEKVITDAEIEKQINLLNKCLQEYTKGKIIGIERNFFILNISKHQVIMQHTVYHVGFKRKPDWL